MVESILTVLNDIIIEREGKIKLLEEHIKKMDKELTEMYKELSYFYEKKGDVEL